LSDPRDQHDFTLREPGSNTVTFFNTSINPSSVATIAGDYGLGCVPWNTAPVNTNGGTAVNNHLYNPAGIASDGTNIYAAIFNDHCIVKIKNGRNQHSRHCTCGTTVRLPMA